eukprot:203291-Rhodomonas_salina.1
MQGGARSKRGGEDRQREEGGTGGVRNLSKVWEMLKLRPLLRVTCRRCVRQKVAQPSGLSPPRGRYTPS